jgi:hypothetical protein
MLTKIHWFTFVLISIAFIINLQSPPASIAADVKYEGNRLSVHANGVPLEQLLSMVEKQTGIQFLYDDLLAETNVYANFENNSLDDGVRRILLQFNYAAIYNGLGYMKTVLVLNRQRASLKSPGNRIKLYAALQETDINDIPDQLEPPPLDLSVTLKDQEDARPFSEQLSEKGLSGHDMPPGATENVIPPPGEEALSPVVNPNVSPPPEAEPLAPVVDPNVSPPPGEDPLEPDNVSTLSSDTEKQDAPQAN